MWGKTWMLVWGLAWLGLTPSFALNLPWASLFPSPNLPSNVWWESLKTFSSKHDVSVGTCMLVLGLAWSDLEAPSFALNLFQDQTNFSCLATTFETFPKMILQMFQPVLCLTFTLCLALRLEIKCTSDISLEPLESEMKRNWRKPNDWWKL